MKTYYSSRCSVRSQSVARSLADPVLVLAYLGVFCTALWLARPAGMTAENRPVETASLLRR